MRAVVARLAADGVLAAEWSREAAAEMLWSLTSLETWRGLMVERGWSAEAYVEHLRRTLRRMLVRER